MAVILLNDLGAFTPSMPLLISMVLMLGRRRPDSLSHSAQYYEGEI
jgi:hypothetical protein